MAELPQIHAGNHKIQITQGSIHKAFFKLAAPAVATMSVEFVLSITDMFFVGRIGGPEPVAILTSSMFVLWIVWSLMMILDIGVVAVISRYFGASEFDRASYVGTHSIGYAVITGLVITVVGIILAPLAFKVMESSPEVAAGGTSYLRIRFLASIPFVINEVIAATFRSTGDTKTPMIASFAVVGTNIILDPLLIFGIGPFPEMGTDGASLASVFAVLVGTVVILLFLRAGKLAIPLKLRLLSKFDYKLLIRITRIGFPLSMASVLFSMVYFILTRIANDFGDPAVAALGIGNRCESISYLLCFGASMATSAMIGQNLGANQPDRAEKAGWVSFMYGAIFTGIISILFFTIPHQISRFFMPEATVEPLVVNYLIILGVSQVFMAAEIILEGAFSGAGDTLPPTIIGVSWSLFRIPLAYFLCFTLDMGITGLWWAISGTSIIKGSMLIIWFKRGKWKLKQV
ncbi:MAG: MATE family efflux transporter [candidate division Zixibacteria bacterium]|nr:MATE family efflux transporter [candidate division Zixibacteria bacterium]